MVGGVDGDGLKGYGCRIEEGGGDLFGLYYLGDEKVVEVGLSGDEEG